MSSFRHKARTLPLWQVVLIGFLLAAQISLAPLHLAVAATDMPGVDGGIEGKSTLSDALRKICSPRGAGQLPDDGLALVLNDCKLCVVADQPCSSAAEDLLDPFAGQVGVIAFAADRQGFSAAVPFAPSRGPPA